jgi:aryl-alcohol dehydrogenase-like predicted oxidoreductase
MVNMVRLATTELDVFPIYLGGNVFGWTADEQTSFDVLDAYTTAGGNFIDTADSYMASAPGNRGGESETILGRWLAKRGRRDDMVIATKVGSWDRRPGLGAKNIRAAAEDSLRRLGIDHIDLYYAHRDDESAPLEETLGAFDALVRQGKVCYIAASNYSAPRLRQALQTSQREGLARYVALQTHYNLMERDYESELAGVAAEHKLAVLPYFALAMGFLTGKYRAGTRLDSVRAERASAYLDERGERVLGVLEQVAAAHQVSMAAVALAWLRAQPTVSVPITSARNTEQLAGLVQAANLELSEEQVGALTEASNRTR